MRRRPDQTAAADRATPDATRLLATLRVTEIFHSLQGETSRSGLPTVFIRLTGCPLRCGYCDTAYAFHGGTTMTVAAVLEAVAGYGTRYVTVTGGEPLAQKSCHALLIELCDRGYSVSLETSGAIDVSAVDARVSKILDIKTPGSGESARNRWENLAHLTARDEIKFVICDDADYGWAKHELADAQHRRDLPGAVFPGVPRARRDATRRLDIARSATGASADAVAQAVMGRAARPLAPR